MQVTVTVTVTVTVAVAIVAVTEINDNIAVRVMRVVTTLHTIVIVDEIHAKQHPAW